MDSQDFTGDLDEMDDLFNEAQSPTLAPPLPAASHTGLHERLQEMSNGGCCDKVAWSNFGSIANIVKEGHGVDLQAIVFDKKTKEPHLSSPESVDLSQRNLVYPIEHVKWSATGLELAIIDSSGQVLIFGIASLNRAQMRFYFVLRDVDVDAGVVGIESLHLFRTPLVNGTARQDGENWNYSFSDASNQGPRNPVPNRSAFLTVTRSANLSLLFGRPNPTWGKICVELGTGNAQDRSISHACFTYKGDGLLLATYDSAGMLQIHSVVIDWGLKAEKGVPQQRWELSPTIELNHLFSYADLGQNISTSFVSSQLRLTSLQMLPGKAQNDQGEKIHATIMATFSAEAQSNLTIQENDNSSHLLTWSLINEPEAVHENFKNTSSSKTKSSQHALGDGLVMRKGLELVLPGSIVSVTLPRMNNILTVAMSNGTFDLRDATTMEPCMEDKGSTMIQNPVEKGMRFPVVQPFLHVSISPNGCMAITRGKEDNLDISCMDFGPDDDSSDSMGVLVGTAILFALANRQFRVNDDIFVLVQRLCAGLGLRTVLDAIYSSVELFEAFSPLTNDPKRSQLVMHPNISRCLSIQHLLSTVHESKILSKAAWIVLATQKMSLTFQATCKLQQHHQAGIADMPLVLLGNIKWCMDLLIYLLGHLNWLVYNLRGKEDNRILVQEEMQSMLSPVLILLLGNIPRVTLIFTCTSLRSLELQASDFCKREVSERMNFKRIVEIINNAPVTIKRFELLLSEIDHHVKAEYKRQNLNPKQITEIEKDFFFTGEIPEALMPIVTRLLTTTFERMTEDPRFDSSKLLFFKTDHWDLAEQDGPQNNPETQRIDILTRYPMSKQKPWKQCTRCSARSEESYAFPPQTQTPLIQNLQKSCICGHPWVVVGA